MRSLYGPKLLPLGMLAIIASLMTGVVGNVSAFASIWTQEIYRTSLRPDRSERHYISMGRMASVVCLALSLAGAFATLWFESLSQFLLAIFSLTLVPFFAVILIGAFSRRCSATHIVTGVLSGVAAGGTFQFAYRAHWLHVGSQLSANFYAAIVIFVTTFSICLAGSVLSPEARAPHGPEESDRLRLPAWRASISLCLLAGLLLGFCILFNVIWR